MPLLDHTAYPGIIDTILDHIDVATCIAFSSTCRAYRARITPGLLHHVALYNDDGRVGFRVPGTGTRSAVPFLPALVRVLDLDGDSWAQAAPPAPGITTLRRPLRDALTSLALVVRRGTAIQDVNDPYKFERVPVVVDDLDLDNKVQVGPVCDLDLGLSMQTHVLRLRWCDDMRVHSDDGRLIHDTEFMFQTYDKFDYVLVVAGYTASAAPPSLGSALEVLRLVLSGLAESGNPPDPQMRITVVGLETTDMVVPHPVVCEGFDEVPEPYRPAAAFLEDVLGSITDYEYEWPSRALWRDIMRYVTFNEWRAGLDNDLLRRVVDSWAGGAV